MKKSTAFELLAQTHISDWLREMWEVEALHPPMIGSRLKFGVPLSPAQSKRRKAKAAKPRAEKA